MESLRRLWKKLKEAYTVRFKVQGITIWRSKNEKNGK